MGRHKSLTPHTHPIPWNTFKSWLGYRGLNAEIRTEVSDQFNMTLDAYYSATPLHELFWRLAADPICLPEDYLLELDSEWNGYLRRKGLKT